jgi:hypothetical protein
MLVAIVSVFVNFLLGVVYFLQLGEMRLATEASRQAVELASESLAMNSSQFDRGMRQTVSQTASQIKATQASIKSAKAAQSAAQTASDQLEMADRPWISADMALVSPFTFDDAGGHVTLQFTLTNDGHTPAFALIRTNFFLSDPKPNFDRNRFCRETPFEKISDLSLSQTVFPGKGPPQNVFLNVAPAQIANAARVFLKEHPREQPPGFITPVLVVCIPYRPSFKVAHYMTSYIFVINQREPADPNAAHPLSPTRKSYPAEQLQLKIIPMRPGSAY